MTIIHLPDPTSGDPRPSGRPGAPGSAEALLEAVGQVSERFLAGRYLANRPGRALEPLGWAVGVDRVYVFRTHRDEVGAVLASQTAEWARPGVEPQIDNERLQNLPLRESGYERWERVLGSGGMIAGPVSDFPAGERSLLESQGVRSLMVTPVFVDGAWWGFLGFDDDRSERHWSDAEIQAIRTVAGILGHALRRQATEEALRQSERRFRSFFDFSNDAIFVFGIEPDGSPTPFIEVNEVACKRLGYSREELLEMTVSDLHPPENRPLEGVDLRTIPGEGIVLTERSHVTRAGTLIPVEINSRRVELDGREVIISIVRDIRERKEAEARIREREDQLRHAQKMQAVGSLAGGVAHDFNNLLTSIQGAASLLSLELGEDHPEAEELRQILVAANRGADLTRQLLEFSREGMVEASPHDLNRAVREMDAMLRRLVGVDVEMKTDLAPGELSVEAGDGQLEQIIVNLVMNARDAVTGVGRIRIRTGRGQDDDGPVAVLVVSDTGSGMDEATMARIFDPFFTTKEVGEGSGLGLSTVYGIVQRAGGSVEVTSEPGGGSEFTIRFPLLTSG